MADLSKIKELCASKGISISKLAKDLGMSQSTLSMAIKTNSTTIDTLERVSKYFNVPVGVFFGEQSVPNNLEDVDKYKKLYASTFENLQAIGGIMLRLFFPCIVHFIWDLELFFSGFFHRVEERSEKKFLGLIGQKSKHKTPLDPKSDEDRRYFIDVYLNCGILGASSNEEEHQQYVYETMIYVLEPTPNDFAKMHKAGILRKKETYIMSLWAKTKYNLENFLGLYSQFRELKEVEDMLDNGRFGSDYNDYEWEYDPKDRSLACLKYDGNGIPFLKKK